MKSFCVTYFAYKFSLTKISKTFFRCNLQNMVFMRFCANVGRHFFPGFSGILPKFSVFFPNSRGFCPDFQQIKTFGVHLHTLNPHLLHH